MASVQELIAAAEHEARYGNPASSVLQNVLSGFNQAQQGGLDRTIKLIQLDEMRRQQEFQAARRQQLQQEQMAMQAKTNTQNEALIRGGFNKLTKVPSVFPGRKVTDSIDEKGNVTTKYETVEAKDPSYQKVEYRDAQGRTRIGRWNPVTGQAEQGPNDPFAPQTARGETAGNLRKEFIDRPEVKEFVTVNTQVKSMDSMLANALAGNLDNQLALDQALITMYNKLTDPTSVVRESEYARTPENLPMINRISGAIEKVQAGGAGLTDEDRKALVVGAKIIANERGRVFSERRGEYSTLAQKMEIDPSIVTGTIADFQPYEIGKPAASPAKPAGSYAQPIALSGPKAARLAELRKKAQQGELK